MTTTTAKTILFESDTRKISRHNYQGYTLIVDSGPYTIVRDYIFHTGQTITETHRRNRKNPKANQTLWKVDGELTGASKAERLLSELLAQNPQAGKPVEKLPGNVVQVAAGDVLASWKLIVASEVNTVVATTPHYLNDHQPVVTMVLKNQHGHTSPMQVGTGSKFLRIAS